MIRLYAVFFIALVSLVYPLGVFGHAALYRPAQSFTKFVPYELKDLNIKPLQAELVNNLSVRPKRFISELKSVSFTKFVPYELKDLNIKPVHANIATQIPNSTAAAQPIPVVAAPLDPAHTSNIATSISAGAAAPVPNQVAAVPLEPNHNASVAVASPR